MSNGINTGNTPIANTNNNTNPKAIKDADAKLKETPKNEESKDRFNQETPKTTEVSEKDVAKLDKVEKKPGTEETNDKKTLPEGSHEVKKGDTLWALLVKRGFSPAEIKSKAIPEALKMNPQLNGNPDKLQVGWVLQLPTKNATPTTEKTVEKKPEAEVEPKTTEKTVEKKPDAKVEQKTTEKPVEKKPDAETPKTSMSKQEFVEKYKDKTIRADTKLPGKAYLDQADLNRDGVISGEKEWAAAFKEVDTLDKNRNADSFSLKDKEVEKSLTNLDAAKDGAVGKKLTLNARSKVYYDQGMANPEPLIGGASKLGAGARDYMGRPLGKDSASLTVAGGGSGGSMELVADPKSGRLYYQAGSGPIVPLTHDEEKAMKQKLKDKLPDPAVAEDAGEGYAAVYYTLYPERKPEECSF